MKTLTIKVLPRSSRNEIVGTLPDGTLKIKLTAPPVDGEANKKLIELLSKKFGVAKSRVKIVRGETSRRKMVEIDV
ncbi:YggU family protein [Candidatus Peregrinibacteria bacterium]|nr:YggU family protein [Candidatus Peregrinibacteria bacterium]PIR75339.1 MAG: YggU family protein [Candidatus Magasanikbacteria bacterium CG10_big_fil_rev_8_21_14_0_10_43_9]